MLPKQQSGWARVQVEAMLDRGIYRNEDFVEGGWVSALRYEDEVMRDLEKRTDSKPDKLKAVRAPVWLCVWDCCTGIPLR